MDIEWSVNMLRKKPGDSNLQMLACGRQKKMGQRLASLATHLRAKDS